MAMAKTINVSRFSNHSHSRCTRNVGLDGGRSVLLAIKVANSNVRGFAVTPPELICYTVLNIALSNLNPKTLAGSPPVL